MIAPSTGPEAGPVSPVPLKGSPLVAAPGAGSTTVFRFTLTERGLHWTHAIFFLLLLVTGIVMFIPALSTAIGHHFLILRIHLTVAIFYICGPLLWFLLGNRRALLSDVRAVDRWYQRDFRWLKPRLPGRPAPPQGRFNAGQKLNAIFVAGSTVGFGATGGIMWQTHLFPQPIVANAVSLHDTLAWLALVAWGGHIYLAALNPATRHSLRGMVNGRVDRAWAEHHHPLWVHELDQQNTQDQ